MNLPQLHVLVLVVGVALMLWRLRSPFKTEWLNDAVGIIGITLFLVVSVIIALAGDAMALTT